jgi:hypothetical protein
VTISSDHLRTRATACLVLATLAIRALVPLGYMPGKLLQGELVELCPVASAATFAFLNLGHAHSHHHGESNDDVPSIGVACPIGSSLFFDAIPAMEVSVAQVRRVHEQPVSRSVAGYILLPSQPHPARGPPHS